MWPSPAAQKRGRLAGLLPHLEHSGLRKAWNCNAVVGKYSSYFLASDSPASTGCYESLGSMTVSTEQGNVISPP